MRLRVRLENQLRYHHLPAIARQAGLVLRFRIFAVPDDDSPDFSARAAHVVKRVETGGKLSDDFPVAIE